MGDNGAGHRWVFIIRDAKVCAGLPDDTVDRRVMDMADPGKKMVFYLKIQAADVPGDDLVPGCKIRGGLYLVNGPLLFQLYRFTRLDVCKFGAFYDMRQLENNSEYKTQYQVHRRKAYQPGLPADEIYRQHHIEQSIEYFTQPEDAVFFPIHFLQRCIHYFPAKVFHKIKHANPQKGGKRVDENHVNMLIAVCRLPFLGGAAAHEGAFCNIIVEAVHIGIRVMNDIVFEFPDKGIAAQRIQGQPHQVVHPFAGGVAAVKGVVHNVKADACQGNAQEAASDDP